MQLLLGFNFGFLGFFSPLTDSHYIQIKLISLLHEFLYACFIITLLLSHLNGKVVICFYVCCVEFRNINLYIYIIYTKVQKNEQI